MDNRTSRELTTPGAHKVVVKEYLTAREVDSVLRDIFKDRETGDGKPSLPMVVGIDRNLKLVEAALVSLDGSEEKAFDRLQDLPASEYAFVLKEVQALANGNF